MAFTPRGIKNVGEFYSQHYLDELLEKDLKGLLQHFGEESPQKALKGLRKKYEQLRRAEKADRERLTQSFHQELLTVLGYPVDDRELHVELEPDLLARVLLDLSVDGKRRVVAVEAPMLEPERSLLETRPLPPSTVRHTEGETSFQEDLEELISTLFTLEEPPRWVLAMAGREVLLAERSRWGQGRYLHFDLDTVLDGGASLELTAAAALLCREAVAPEQGTAAHDLLDENSHRHAYGVSEDLKYNLREAVELLGNAWVRHQRESKKKLYEGDGTSLFDDTLARELTNECLTFLYRLLFIFFAEARGEELGVLPMNSESYRLGYSLEHLRDLELVPLHGAEARGGTFIHESIEQLFALLHCGQRFAQSDALRNQKFTFEVPALDSALFAPRHTPRLSSARLPNAVMQQVLQLLSLSREGAKGKGRKRGRGRISYARLGINQLGAVYEGLLSYTGFFAREDLYELKKEGKNDDGDVLEQVFFARASEVERFKDEEVVQIPDPLDPERKTKRKVYPKGSFVYRLAGRDRERSASYYTPEVLTRCVVKYALKELLPGKSADEILKLTLCEPAMGSGAFLNEGINQLADAYLERKQAERGERIPQAQYAIERQRVKAYLATHNAYGVDLNPVAVNLAKVSLWLNILGPGIPVPWFDLRLGVGNSLVGCRRQIFRAKDVLRKPTKTSPNFLGLVPEAIPLDQPLPEDGILHFLLPDEGMGAVADNKVATTLAEKEVKRLKDWRKSFISSEWTKEEVKRLVSLSKAADQLWKRHVDDRRSTLNRTVQTLPVWGQPVEAAAQYLPPEGREQIVAEGLGQPGAAGRRLQLAMDAWCRLWSCPLEKVSRLPDREKWLSGLEALLTSEGAVDVAAVKQAHPWLAETGSGCFHWELTFAEVFSERGGFDLVLGNPPWVKLEWKEAGILSEFDATLGVRDHSAAELAKMREALLNSEQRKRDYLGELTTTTSLQSLLSAKQAYPLLGSSAVNLYKNFLCLGWVLGSQSGVAGFIHQEGAFDDPKGRALRAAIYERLRFRFEFMNKLMLFREIKDEKHYGLLVSTCRPRTSISFKMIGNCLHPKVIDDSLIHLGTGPVPGIKDGSDNWDVRGHSHRAIDVDEQTLGLFAKLYDEPGTPVREARLPVVHSTEMLQVLERLAAAPKLADLRDSWFPTMMWNETNQQKDGTIVAKERDCRTPEEWIVSGPHIYVARPFNKTPNPGCKHNQDYAEIDLTRIPDDFLPRTRYSPGCTPKEYRVRTPTFKRRPVTDFYRHVHRTMVVSTGERTLIGAIVPPGCGHIDLCFSMAFADERELLQFHALASSLPVDYFVRSTGKGHARSDVVRMLPFPRGTPVDDALIVRALRLNCLTTHFKSIWEQNWSPSFAEFSWTKSDRRLSTEHVTPKWNRGIALRNDFERRQALVEVDALSALALGISINELVQIYRVQFPVLLGYERENRYDQTGRLVSTAALNLVVKRGQTEGTITDPNDPSITYVLPFDGCDREADMRQAYAEFQRRHAEAASEVA